MAVLIDSSVFIEAERRRLTLPAIVALADRNEALGLSALTDTELLFGVHLTPPSPQRAEREAFVENMIASLPILNFDVEVARV